MELVPAVRNGKAASKTPAKPQNRNRRVTSAIRLVPRYVHPTAEQKRSAMLHYDEIMKAAEKAAGEHRRMPN